MVSYVPISYEKRIGRSKVRMIRDSLRTLQYIFECIARYNPLKLFILFAVLSVALGVLSLHSVGLILGIIGALLIMSVGILTEAVRKAR